MLLREVPASLFDFDEEIAQEWKVALYAERDLLAADDDLTRLADALNALLANPVIPTPLYNAINEAFNDLANERNVDSAEVARYIEGLRSRAGEKNTEQ